MTLNERESALAISVSWWLIAAFAIGLLVGWAMGVAR